MLGDKMFARRIRIIAFLATANAVIVGSCLIFKAPEGLMIYAGLSAAVGAVAQVYSFIDAIQPFED